MDRSKPQVFVAGLYLRASLPLRDLSPSAFSLPIYLPTPSHLSSSSNFTFYTVNPALYFSGTGPILWIAFYPGTRSMSQGEHVACNLCGSRIYSFSSTQISEIVYRDTRKDLDASPLHYPWVHGNPADLDDIHFNETWTWSCTFRAVFIRTGQGVTFHLSGVGELRPTHQISLPQDENRMILWNHRSDRRHIPLTPNFVSRLEYPKAFPMHERCWQLMTRILDADVIKRNLDIFVRAMFNAKLLTCAEPGFNSILVSHEVRAVLDLASPVAKEASTLSPRFHPSTETFRAMDHGNPSHMTRYFPGADPLNNSYIDNVVAKYTAKYTKQREKGFKPKSQPTIATHKMSRRSQTPFKTSNVFLPTELILNITDHMKHHGDIRNLLLVFPHWHPMVPDSYWRRRFIDDNYLENDRFPAVDALDWQYVYLNTDKLFGPSFGWRNRQHITRQLESVKERFLQRLERKGIQE